MAGPFPVVVGSGTLRSDAPDRHHFDHRWTADGVTVEAEFTGAHLLHLAVGGCVLNDLHREAAALGVTLDGVRVAVHGEFDRTTWASTGIEYSVVLDSPSPRPSLDHLLEVVDDLAEIPRAVRSPATVRRVP
jgi:uncharacterized OsmC-like protein